MDTTPTLLALLSLLSSAVAYFYRRVFLALTLLLIFYSLCGEVSYGLLCPEHSVLFLLLMAIFVVSPLSLLVAFALDVRYGWFCFDMAYSWVVVWAFAPIFLGINIVLQSARFLMPHTQ